MVQVTPKAARHLTETRNQRGLSGKASVRFVSYGSGVGLTFSGQPEAGDTKIMAADLPVFLAPEVADRLDGSTIDVAESEGQMKLFVLPSEVVTTSPRQHPS